MQVRTMRRQQRVADRLTEFVDLGVDREAEMIEGNPPRERVAVCMQAARGQPDQNIADGNAAAIDKHFAFDGSDNKSSKIVFTFGVKPGHLRRLAAEQCAPILATRAGK